MPIVEFEQVPADGTHRHDDVDIGSSMALRKVTSDPAFALLREAGNNSNLKLREATDQVVLTGSLDPWTPG